MSLDRADEDRPEGLRAKGLSVMRKIMPGVIPDGDVDMRDGGLAEELVEIGIVGVFGQMWARDALTLRDRSMVTISMLIAIGSSNELKSHLTFGLNNGLSPKEIEEIIYHSAGYVGYPKSISARSVAKTLFTDRNC